MIYCDRNERSSAIIEDEETAYIYFIDIVCIKYAQKAANIGALDTNTLYT